MLPLVKIQSPSLYIDIIIKKNIFHSTVTGIGGLLFSEHYTGHCWTLRTAVISLRQESLLIKHLTKLPVGSERTPLLLDGEMATSK